MRATSRTAVPARANVTEIRHELMTKYGYTYDAANDVIKYTVERYKLVGKASEWKTPDAEGFITVRYHGLSRFTLEDHREFPRKPLARRAAMEYNRGSKGLPERSHQTRRDSHMPPAKGRRSTAKTIEPPEQEASQNGEVDYQKYLDKDLSPTMSDYVEWFEDNVAALEDVPVDKLLALGSSLYPHFQKSEFNISRREERRSTRAPEPEPEPAKPARGGRGRGRAAAAAPEPEPEPAAAPARRGRGSRAARAGAEAPY